MANSHVLALSASDLAGLPTHYTARLDDDNRENYNRDAIDAFAGHLTASFCEVFHVSGALANHLGQGSVHGGEYYGGLRYNASGPRHIVKVLAFTSMTGSGGVTTVDVQKGTGRPTSNESLFSDLVFKVNLSASDGNSAAESSTFAASSQSWAAGEFLGVCLDEVAAGSGVNEPQDLVVQVYWKPSASYGS